MGEVRVPVDALWRAQTQRAVENFPISERTDHLRFGPIEIAFWVCGTFELVDGRITLWHDHFSWENFLRGTAQGLWGALLRRH